MAYIVLAGILGLAFSTLQLLLMSRVLKVRSGWLRGILLFLKVPLWGLAFVGIALWWGTGPLLAFGLAAGALYLTASIIYYLRKVRVHQ